MFPLRACNKLLSQDLSNQMGAQKMFLFERKKQKLMKTNENTIKLQ